MFSVVIALLTPSLLMRKAETLDVISEKTRTAFWPEPASSERVWLEESER
jgi:hypothetical protein